MHAWWTKEKYCIHKTEIEYGYSSRTYARKLDGKWYYAIVEFRCGTAYLFGLYCDGSNITPVGPGIIE